MAVLHVVLPCKRAIGLNFSIDFIFCYYFLLLCIGLCICMLIRVNRERELCVRVCKCVGVWVATFYQIL
jgi:hypothetical protein